MQRAQSNLRLEVKGVVLLTVVALLAWLSVAIYQKRFTSTVDVTVETERAGLQLNTNADVRMRGALIGRVSDIDQRDGLAVITLALDEGAAEHIPADVEARILPTTLFGQKYVALVAPPGTDADPIEAGAVIPQDRSAAAIEITQAFDHLEPLLTAVRPQDLSSTLQAVAEGLEGRGDQLGRTAEATLQLLRDFREHLPLLTEDLRLLAAVSDMYATSMDDVLALLDNAAFTSRSVVDVEQELESFFGDVTTLSETTAEFLDRNGDGIVELTKTTVPVLQVLERYAPEFPCLLEGLVLANTEFNSVFRDDKLLGYTELGLQYPGYAAPDAPAFEGDGPGPSCAGMPHPGGPRVVMPRFNDGGRYFGGQLVVP